MRLESRGFRWIKLSCLLTVILALFIVLGLLVQFTVIEISSPERLIRVCESDEMIHSYTHSMYMAPVREKFIIQNGRMKLVSVNTPNVAVLEYFGLNKENTNDLDLVFDSFTIPVASIGGHSITVGNTQVDLWTGTPSSEKIEIRVGKINLFKYLLCLFWG